MLHACDQRFDVTENFENFYELNKVNKAWTAIAVAVAAGCAACISSPTACSTPHPHTLCNPIKSTALCSRVRRVK